MAIDVKIEAAMWEAAWDALEYLRSHLDELVRPLLEEYVELWLSKQNDYGPENIGVFLAQGCVIRGVDKDMRLKGYYIDGRPMQNETVEDSWLDKIGYDLIGLVCERGLWPKFALTDILAEMKRQHSAAREED